VSSIFPEVQDKADAQTPVLYFCFYLGFVLINFIVALATLSIFLRTLHLIVGPWRHSAFLQYSIILLLFSNQITQLFTWTVHTQLFNLLTPLYCLYVGLLIAAGNISEYRVRWICFVSGLLLLFYGNFLLVLPMVFVA